MKRFFTSTILAFIGGHLSAQAFYTVCPGAAQTISISTAGLTNPTYSLEPGSVSSPNGVWTVTANAATTYTLYVTGTNSSNALETKSVTTTIELHPVPYISSVSSLQSFTLGCGAKSTATISISASTSSFAPTVFSVMPVSSPSANVSGWLSNSQQTVNVAGNYLALAAYMGGSGCYDTLQFSVTDNKTKPVFTSLTPPNPHMPCVLDYKAVMIGATTTGGSVAWKAPDGSSHTGANHLAFLVGTYTLTTLHAATGCQADTFITVQPEPVFHSVSVSPKHFTLCGNATSVALTATVSGQTAGVTFEWLKWGFPHQTVSTTTLYVASSLGVYIAAATNSLGCTVEVLAFVDQCVGMAEHQNKSIRIWPNPAGQTLHIDAPAMLSGSMHVYSVTGKKMMTVHVNDSPVSVDDLTPGIYMLETEQGRIRFLKE